MGFALELLEGHRTRLTRIRDVRFIHGWVRTVEGSALFAEAPLGFPVDLGDAFAMEALIREQCVHLSVTLLGVGEPINLPQDFMHLHGKIVPRKRLFHFKIDGPPKTSPSQEKERYLAELEPVTIDEHPRVRAYLADFSESGLGILVDTVLPSKERVTMTFTVGENDFQIQAEVRYCRSLGPETELKRIGLAITGMSRLDIPRWQALMAKPVYSS